MKQPIAFLGILASIFLFLAAAQQVQPPAEDGLVIKARTFLEALSRSDFVAAVKDFDETMMKVSGPDKLAEFWKQVPERMGAFKRQAAARREQLGNYDIVLVTCEFEKVTLDARVVFDKAEKIAGFQFVPSLPPAKYEPPKYADPAKFVEREVTIGSGEWTLPGTLTVPHGDGPFPALVLVHGSGPNDRDETLGPNKPFKDIAWGLATQGIAVLRYEKRTRMYGPKLVADTKIAASFTVKEESIGDALEAVRLLQATAGIDRKRIFVLGHSLGGMLVPRIALAGENLGVAGYIVMAGLTRPLDLTYLQQMTYLHQLDGELSEEDKKQLEEIKSAIAKIEALQDSDKESGEKLLNAPPAYWLDLRGYYPPDLALKVSRPMLILQGKRDYQVTTLDFENWQKALSGRSDVEFRLYPKLNHLFIEGQGIPTPNEYTLIHGNVAEEVISDIEAFIRKH
ncbi:MAG: alpha/beta fold hydrolase [Acidobacteriota bacterium]